MSEQFVDPIATPESIVNNLSERAKQVTIERRKYHSPWENHPGAPSHLKGYQLDFKLGDDRIGCHEYDGKVDVWGTFGLRYSGLKPGMAGYQVVQDNAVAICQRMVKYARDNGLKIDLYRSGLPNWWRPVVSKLKALGYRLPEIRFGEYA
jgi:hypothetical protein